MVTPDESDGLAEDRGILQAPSASEGSKWSLERRTSRAWQRHQTTLLSICSLGPTISDFNIAAIQRRCGSGGGGVRAGVRVTGGDE